jgi:hypothetical protein
VTRTSALFIALALVISGCSSELGRSVPECEAAGATTVLAVQSVPGSAYVSCVNGLKAGWDYNHLTALNGQSTYDLDSDRLGLGFLRVDNVQSCDVGSATLESTIEPDIELWKAVASCTTIDIVIVPEGLNRQTMARLDEVLTELEDLEIKGKAVVVESSVSSDPIAERIETAARSGAHVVIISVRDAEEGTVTLLLRGTDRELAFDDLDDALDEIEDAESPSSYVGNWYYVFPGGCVVYTFDAKGSGVDTLEQDVTTALSLYDAEELRQVARDAGYRIP